MKQVVLCVSTELGKTLFPLSKSGYEIIRHYSHVSLNALAEIVANHPDIIIFSASVTFDPGLTFVPVALSLRSKVNSQIIIHLETEQKDILQRLVADSIYDFVIGSFGFANILDFINHPRALADVSEYYLADYDPAFDDEIDLELPEIGTTVIVKEVEKEVVHEIQVMGKGLKDIIAVYGYPNSGKTFIAVNLAAQFAQNGARTALVEGDIEKKDLYIYCGLPDGHKGLRELMFSKTESVLTYAEKIKGNLYIFGAMPNSQIELPENFIFTIQDQLRRDIDFIITDSQEFSILKAASRVLVVVNPSLSQYFGVKQEIDKLISSGINPQKFEIVLNQFMPTPNHQSRTATEILGFPVITTIQPLYPLSIESTTVGKPAVFYGKEAEPLRESLNIIVNQFWTTTAKKKGFPLFGKGRGL